MADLGSMDFSMKPQVDITAIASVLQRKKQMEIEAKQQRRQQNLQELGQAIQLGTQLTSTLVNRSKEQQKMQFVKNLGESMAQSVPMQTTQFPAPTQLSSQVPPVTSVASPNLEKQNLMRDATMVDPEEAAKSAMKIANPQIGNNRPMQFQRQTLIGSNGKPRQVSVGVIGNQMVNPYTQEPVDMNDPKQVDALPEYGFVQREEVAGSNDSGMPVYRNPVSQETYTKDHDGNKVAYNGKILPKLANAPAGITESVSELDYSQQVLGRIADNFNPDFVGPVAARAGKMTKYLEALTDEQRVEFYGNVAEYKNSIIKAITGAQMSEVEAARIIQQIPDENASPTAFRAGLKRAYIATKQRIDAKVRGAERGGYAIRDRSEDGEKIQKMIDAKFDKFLGTSSSSTKGKSLGEGFEGFSWSEE